MIRDAADGDEEQRTQFVVTYGAAIRAYLDGRWVARAERVDLDDAVQEVYLECLRADGVLERSQRDRPRGFRPFLLGVVRNVARRVEERRAGRRERQATTGFQRNGRVDDDSDPARLFDRAWAMSVVREARQLLESKLAGGGFGGPAPG